MGVMTSPGDSGTERIVPSSELLGLDMLSAARTDLASEAMSVEYMNHCRILVRWRCYANYVIEDQLPLCSIALVGLEIGYTPIGLPSALLGQAE